MKKYILISLCLLFLLVGCGEAGKKDETNNDTTQVAKDTTTTQPQPTAESPLANKEFGFGLNMKDCDGLTYSEYSATLKFGAGNTVTQTVSGVGNMGSPDVFEIRTVSKGTYNYAIDNGTVSINFTEKKEEHIRDGKVFKTQDHPPVNLNLKMGKCEDGRPQLLSDMKDKNAMGEQGTGGKSGWSLKKTTN